MTSQELGGGGLGPGLPTKAPVRSQEVQGQQRKPVDSTLLLHKIQNELINVPVYLCLHSDIGSYLRREVKVLENLLLAMDACARIRGVPLRSRATVRKEIVRESGVHSVKSLFKNKKDLCSICLELPIRDTTKLTEINFVCLPSQCEGEEASHQTLLSLPVSLCELLRPHHIQNLKQDEVLLLKDNRRIFDHKDAASQVSCKAVCVMRHSSTTSVSSKSSVSYLLGLLGCYMAGIRYALEQHVPRGFSGGHPDEDDTNQSVSSIEDDFVTALEHLEDDDTSENPGAASFRYFKKRDKSSKHKTSSDTSVTVQRSEGVESQWTICSPKTRLPCQSDHISDSEESDCSSPSPIIFLDDVGYQKSLLAKLDIPQVPGGPRDRVEDSDSEVSEFFDSFDQFDDLDEQSNESCTLAPLLDPISASTTQNKAADASTGRAAAKYVSRGCSTKGMNPQCFEAPTLPADVKKPTPLKPGSPYSNHSELPDSPRPVHTPSDENGGPLFSPVSSSAFSPLTDASGNLEYFWKTDEDGSGNSELRKPKMFAHFCIDISDNKNLSCVCHKEFKNPLGYVMKLSEIQETVTVAKLQKTSQSLKDGIQRFATDLVEMSLGSAFRDLQNSVSSCTTTLCHLAARLTSSVFQMAFHEIGMRHAYVLKERAINGLAGFLVGEALSGALSEFLTVKKQIFHNTVTRFAADLAEELVFEGIMEVCQFSHPSTPHTPSDRTFGLGPEMEEEEEIVSSYASDLSESVLQEAFIQLSQADVTFTSQAAVSLSVNNMCYVTAENTHSTTTSTYANQQVITSSIQGSSKKDTACTVKKALLTVSGMASCVPVPKAGHALSHSKEPDETLPEKSSHSKNSFQNFSGNMVDMVVTEACELITASKVKKSFGDCADFFGKIGSQRISDQQNVDPLLQSRENRDTLKYDCKESSFLQHGPGPSRNTSLFQGRTKSHIDPRIRSVGETHPVLDTLDVPSVSISGQRKISIPMDEIAASMDLKSRGTPGTPPSTPQQHSEISKEKQIKQIFPSHPPPTPHYQPEPDPKLKDQLPEAEKAEFMIKLMRSLSEEAEGNENEEDEDMPEDSVVCLSSRRMSNKEALHYAERLACHIVSMATEIDTIEASDEEGEMSLSGEKRRDSVAQFSEQTLNALWVYAGEVAGEVINDVKQMVSSGQQCPYHAAIRRRSYDRENSERSQWSNDLIASVLRSTPSSSTASSSSSGLSSGYPSCESVTDEYAGYLIKVLKKEGGSRELVLDHSCQQENKAKISSTRLSFSKSLTDESKMSESETSPTQPKPLSENSPSAEEIQCSCKSEERDQKEYVDLVNFAESLAFSITCDVTQKMHRSSVRLPKSLTDSCLYKKSQHDNMAEHLIRNSFSCPVLSREGQKKHHHSTGSLYDSSYSSKMMQVIEHYARKIVDDTLKISLASIETVRSCCPGHNVRERACHYCQLQERPFCSKFSTHQHFQPVLMRRRGPEGQSHSSVDIPKIHIHLDRKAAFAEEMVSMAMEVAKRELSNTSLNADSGIGYDGTSFAESLTAEIMTSALTNVCQATSSSSQGREVTESTVSQQLSVGDDSLGSWSNLSFEDEHPDDNSSFLHLSDSSNGNSSSWSSLGLEGEACEECLSSPSDSDHIEDKDTENKEESIGTVCTDRTEVQAPRSVLVILNSDVLERVWGHSNVTLDPQLRSLLQWVAASMADIPQLQLNPDRELQQLPAVVQKLREKKWRVGELLHSLLRYCEDSPAQSQLQFREESVQASRESTRIPLFQWLLEYA
ncbi:hypothetical protein WMY93_028493 [Mugilogobius chulae]|uniref:A-kinase anchor protein 11 n=1 Tax=Mugilogobius chulae TaxID=88201 RepID=A0AAW0MXC8_9GOBI